MDYERLAHIEADKASMSDLLAALDHTDYTFDLESDKSSLCSMACVKERDIAIEENYVPFMLKETSREEAV